MNVVSFEFPSEREEELVRRFTVNRHYLASLAYFLTAEFGGENGLYSGIKESAEAHPPFLRVQGVGAA